MSTYEESNNRGTLTLEGDLSLAQTEEFRMLLIKAIINVDELVIAFGKIRDVDLSCLQLLCSAHRSSDQDEKTGCVFRNLAESVPKGGQRCRILPDVGMQPRSFQQLSVGARMKRWDGDEPMIEPEMENIVEKLRETFREEAYELLAELESALLELEKNPGDMEQIGRVFRAMHTIKGSGGVLRVPCDREFHP